MRSYQVFLTHGTLGPNQLVFRRPDRNSQWMGALAEHLEASGSARIYQHFWSGSLLGPWNKREISTCASALEKFLGGLSPSDTVVFIVKSNGSQLVENAIACLDQSLMDSRRMVEIRLSSPLRGSSAHASLFSKRYWLTSDSDSLFKNSRRLLRLFCPTLIFLIRHCRGLKLQASITSIPIWTSR